MKHALRPAALVAVPLVVAPLLTVAANSVATPAAEAAGSPCLVTDYLYSIRHVTHSAPAWHAYRTNFQTFGPAQTITKGKRLSSSNNSNLSSTATISASVEGKAEVDDILSKVEVDAKIGSSYKSTYGSTSSEASVVTVSTTEHIPKNSLVITFKARKKVSGTYQISQCNADSKASGVSGHIVWKTHNWSAYSTSTASGTWIGCKNPNKLPYLADAQKRAGCS